MDRITIPRSEVDQFCAEVCFDLSSIMSDDPYLVDAINSVVRKIQSQSWVWQTIDQPQGGIPASIAVAVHPCGAWKAVGEGDINGVQDYEQAVADAAEMMHNDLLTECQFVQVNVVLPIPERTRVPGFIATV